MKIVPGIRHLPHALEKTSLTIGNFDGIHLGHRELIGRAVDHARKTGGSSAAMTFDPHPMTVLRPEQAPGRLFSVDDQHREMAALGVDWLVSEPFSREFSQISPERFLLDWIFKPFHPDRISVGYDFAFGEGKRGDIEFLRQSGAKLDFEVEVIAPVKTSGHLISSTRIRQALSEGDVGLAREMLGRPFYLQGLVEKGAGRGHKIGWPTANLRTESETFPTNGVYAAWASFETTRAMAMVNVGRNPTFVPASQIRTSAPPLVEAHIVGLGREIYGETLRLEFIARLRDEKKFSGVDELVRQIGLDVETGKTILSKDSGARPGGPRSISESKTK